MTAKQDAVIANIQSDIRNISTILESHMDKEEKDRVDIAAQLKNIADAIKEIDKKKMDKWVVLLIVSAAASVAAILWTQTNGIKDDLQFLKGQLSTIEFIK